MMEKTITNEQLNLLPLGQFNGTIVVVDSKHHVNSVVDQLRCTPLLGFDTETKPSFKKGVIHKVALLQLSTNETCYLFRLNKTGLTDSILSLFEDPRVVKVGVGVRDDLRMLNELVHFNPQGFVELQDIAIRQGFQDTSLKKLAAMLLDIRISKRQRLSNWEAEALSDGQLMYAATDAWIAFQIYQELMNGRSAETDN